MATALLELIPGVDTNRTPVWNQAAISSCNLIRFFQDRRGAAMPQKLGGWTAFYAQAMPSIVRQLWPFEDANNNQYLGIGCSTATNTATGAPLLILQNGALNNITPLIRQDNVAPSVVTTTSSSTVFINDTGSNANNFTSVFVATHIAVGGIIVFGFYQCIETGADQFGVNLYDTLGNPVFPLSGVTGGVVAQFTTTSGSNSVNVNLPNHGYIVQNTYPILVSTAVGGATLFGNYLVQEVIDSDNFTIFAATQATSGTSASINGGNAQYDFYVGLGPLPTGSGYGVGGYGVGGYGSGITPAQPTGQNIQAVDWSLDNFGSIFVACPVGLQFGPDGTNPIGGPVYIWNPQSNTALAEAVPQGPVCNDGIFVAMPQRQIVAWGSTFTGVQDHLLLRWCDVQNYTQWVAQSTNQAGSYRIPRGSRIVGCIQVAQQALVFTDLAVWDMQYIGQPYIYSFNEIGTGCGLIAPKAATSLLGIVYWMSQSQFFTLAGSGVAPLLCPIWDQVFQQIDQTKLRNIRVAPNSRFNEVAWHFTSTSSPNGENDMYVKYNVQIQQWDYGSLQRSAWTNQSVLGPPIGADPSGLILYQHETSNDAAGQAMDSWFQTGFFEASEGRFQTFIDMLLPDFKYGDTGGAQNATILITLYAAQYSGDTPIAFGPYSVTEAATFVSTRLRARLIALRVESNDIGSFWRLGGFRYQAIPDGRY